MGGLKFFFGTRGSEWGHRRFRVMWSEKSGGGLKKKKKLRDRQGRVSEGREEETVSKGGYKQGKKKKGLGGWGGDSP